MGGSPGDRLLYQLCLVLILFCESCLILPVVWSFLRLQWTIDKTAGGQYIVPLGFAWHDETVAADGRDHEQEAGVNDRLGRMGERAPFLSQDHIH